MELIKLHYYASKTTIYAQILVFKTKDAAKMTVIVTDDFLAPLLHH